MTSTLSPHDTDAEYRTVNLSHFLRPDRLRRPDATGEQPVYRPSEPVVYGEALVLREAEPAVYRSEPQGRPDRYRGQRRMPMPPPRPLPRWAKAVIKAGLTLIGGAVGGGAVMALAVLQAGGAW